MQPIHTYIIDMDGVLITGTILIPGANNFINRLQELGKKYLVLTNNPLYTPKDLAHRLQSIGLEIDASHIFTSAMATANFLHSQLPNGTAYVIGESGLTEAIHNIGYVITDLNPDYVVLGETQSYNYETITKAVRLIEFWRPVYRNQPGCLRSYRIWHRARLRRNGSSDPDRHG